MKRVLIFMLVVLGCSLSAHAQCDLNATPANFAAQLSAIPAGQSLCLASGNYGSFNGATKSSLTHVRPAVGASVSFSGANVGSSTKNIYLHGPITWTGPVEISPGAGGLNFWIEGTWANVGHASHEGRVSISCSSGCGSSGVHIMNSHFGPGGCSDGIQISAPGVEVGMTEFAGILQGSCSEHVDPIQLYAGDTANIHDVWIHNNDQGVMAPDGSVGTIIKNSVIKAQNNYDLVMGNCRNCVITHNVANADIYDGNPANQPTCTQKKSTNSTYQNNVGTMSGCGTNIINDHNLTTVTFVGGANPTTFAGYATAAPLGTASDGTNIGVNLGTPPPPQINVTVAPSTVSMMVNGTQQFTSSVTGTTNQGVTWSATSGTVSTMGLYMAPSSATTATVRATSVADTSKVGAASVTVSAVVPPPSFPAPGKRGSVKSTANIRSTACNNCLGPMIGSAPTGSTFSILAVSSATVPGVTGAVWVQVDYDDPSLPTGYMGSDNMTEVTGTPPPPTITLNCTVAKAGVTGSNVPTGTVLTITASIPNVTPVSCTTSLP